MPSQKPFTYEEFKAIYSKVPRLSVDVIVRSPEGVALTLRTIEPHNGAWHIPGSTVLYGESALETARRVARDELNLEIRGEKLIGYIEYNEEAGRGFGRSLSLVFLCAPAGGSLRHDGDASAAAYFKKLPPNIIPEQKEVLEKALAAA